MYFLTLTDVLEAAGGDAPEVVDLHSAGERIKQLVDAFPYRVELHEELREANLHDYLNIQL